MKDRNNFVEKIVDAGTTLRCLKDVMGATGYTVRVNQQTVSDNHVLQDNNTVTFIKQNKTGGLNQ